MFGDHLNGEIGEVVVASYSPHVCLYISCHTRFHGGQFPVHVKGDLALPGSNRDLLCVLHDYHKHQTLVAHRISIFLRSSCREN